MLKSFVKLVLLCQLLSCFFSCKLVACPCNVDQLIRGADYIFCIQGGASKTSFQVLDSKGQTILLKKNDQEVSSFTADSMNISVKGEENFEEVVNDFFKDTYISKTREPLLAVVKKSSLLGGWSGLGREKSREFAKSVFLKIGFQENRIGVFTDAGLAIHLVGDEGGVLIAGTGSICFIKDRNEVKRYGGLGYRIGDQGSGYSIGLRAIRAAILDEYCNGTRTQLTDPIKKLFQIDVMSDLIIPINSNEIAPSLISAVAPIVFNQAKKNDLTAKILVEKSAKELAKLTAEAITKSSINNPNIYLLGGLFRDDGSQQFIDMILKSSYILCLPEKKRPIMVNLSKLSIPVQLVKETLKYQDNQYYAHLQRLPIVQDMLQVEPFSTLDKSYLTTEQECEETKFLSQTYNRNPALALELLYSQDSRILEGAERYSRSYLEGMHEFILQKIQQSSGRIFLVGAGNSGRLAVDLAAKWNNFWKNISPDYENTIVPVLAGGPDAFVASKVTFEDEAALGYQALSEQNLNKDDTVILISSSGSSQFNLGAAHYANQVNSKTFYLHNSKVVPRYTQQLFDMNQVTPILVDIGSQSITGATEVQGAALCELCLAVLLDSLINKIVYQSSLPIQSRALELILSLERSWSGTKSKIPEILKLVDMQSKLLMVSKVSQQKSFVDISGGCVTFLSTQDCIRETMMDCICCSPVSFLSAANLSSSRYGKKEVFRSFLTGAKSNLDAWETLFAQKMKDSFNQCVLNTLVSQESRGYGDFDSRFKSKDNILLGVVKSHESTHHINRLMSELEQKKREGVKIAIFAVEDKKRPFSKSFYRICQKCDVAIILDQVEKDPLGIVSTLTLKQALALNSLGLMLDLNKILGNSLLDINPVNQKLLDRTIRVVQKVLKQVGMPDEALDYQMLYDYVTRVNKYRELNEQQLNTYIPSPTKIVVTMIKNNCTVQEAVETLINLNESLEASIDW